MVTIIPSQSPYCAIHKFSEIGKRAPPTWDGQALEHYVDALRANDELPDGLVHLSWKSFFDLRQDGGCNDLIFSGHYLVITCSLCLFAEICNGQPFRVYAIKWIMIIWAVLAALDMIDKGHHYSIDVLLATIIPVLYWQYISFPNSMFYKDIYLPTNISEHKMKTEFAL